MKKILVSLMVLSFILMACGGSNDTVQTSSNSEPKDVREDIEKVAETPTKDFEGNYEEIGEGSFIIKTESGTSENGNIPFIFAAQDEFLLTSFHYEAEGFDGTHLTYIYVDGMECEKNQLRDTWSDIIVTNSDEDGNIYKGNPLETGIHDVEVVQFDTDKPDGEVIFYRKLQYEVKAE